MPKLRDASRQSLTVPLRREMDRGTLLAIYRRALRYIPEDDLRSQFYTDRSRSAASLLSQRHTKAHILSTPQRK